jgi:hypothetical protein
VRRHHARVLFAGAALASLFAFAGSAQAECPNEAVRNELAKHLPDCRGYERVSPPDAGAGLVGLEPALKAMFGAAGADGNGMVFGAAVAVGDPQRGATKTFHLARRTATGWDTWQVLDTTQPDVPMDLSMLPATPTPSADMSRMLFRTASRSLGPPNPITGNGSVYLSTFGQAMPTWLSHWSFEGTQPNPALGGTIPLGGTADLSSGYFAYSTPLTSVAGDELRTSRRGLYFFHADGSNSPAGRLPSGIVDPLGAIPAGTATSGNTANYMHAEARNQVSADGSHLFFVTPAEGTAPKQLYVEEGDGPGRLISADAEGNPAATGVAQLEEAEGVLGTSAGDWRHGGYAYATPDGSRVLFASADALTDDAPAAGVKIYRAEITASSITVEYLPGVDGYPTAIDADASTVLVATAGSEPGMLSFEVWDEGHPGAAYPVVTDLPANESRPVYEPVFSDDGEVLVFASGSEIEPGIAPLPEVRYTQVYRWTKEGGPPVCISCRRDGGTPARFGARLSNNPTNTTDNPAFPNGSSSDVFNQSSTVTARKISSDGSRVFFDSSDPLDPTRDVNGQRDVYMWENGEDHLLTSGRSQVPSYVIDSGESGNDVFVLTADGLIPSDTNQTYDVYDVRVDGGFAEPKLESCEGDACQGQGTRPGEAMAPASAKLVTAGNRHESRKAKARARKALGATQLGRPGSSSARVRIQVPAAGRVSIAGADVKSESRAVKRGTVVIGVGLSSTGKSKLARKGQLRTTVRVTFRPKSGAATKKTVKLSFASPKGAR